MSVLMVKALVVDDLKDNREILARCLIRMGHEVDTASNGCDALDIIHRRTPDIVLLDLMMPEMDGFIVIKKVREKKSCEQLPIIAVSARHDAEAVSRALKIGADDYITKPFHAEVVRARVEKRLLQAKSAAMLRKAHADFETKIEAERLSLISGMLSAENPLSEDGPRFWFDE